MQRRQFSALCGALLGAGSISPAAHGQTLTEISGSDASQALKTALEKGALAAVSQLGRQDGFMGSERLRISLPPSLQGAEQLLRTLGQGGKLDELILAMNRGAEAAVPLAKKLFIDTARNLSIDDAKTILRSGDTAVTEYFAGKTRGTLQAQFLPIVTRATGQVGLAGKYNEVAGKGAELGLLKKEDANLERYVTGKALDSLYRVIGDEERKIRQNPVAYGSTVLTKVFGALR